MTSDTKKGNKFQRYRNETQTNSEQNNYCYIVSDKKYIVI